MQSKMQTDLSRFDIYRDRQTDRQRNTEIDRDRDSDKEREGG